MTNLVVLSDIEKNTDNELPLSFNTPISILDPFHESIPPELKKEILRQRYHDKLIADGIETGHFQVTAQGITFVTKQPIYSFAGFIFEAFSVRIVNDNINTIGKYMFSWCTKREKVKNDYINQFKAIGTGFITTKSAHPDFYSFQHKFDILFIRYKNGLYEPATLLGTTREAGIQIKAITGNEKSEIIEPLISGKYTNVLTYLRHPDTKIHSYEVCMEIIKELYRQRSITLDRKNDLESRIKSPEMLGIDQRMVDEYYEYICAWYQGRATWDMNIYDGIGLEVKGYKYSNGILIPDN